MQAIKFTPGEALNEAEAQEFIRHIDNRIQAHLESVLESEMWRTLSDPETDPALARAIFREVHLEIYAYQPHVTEASYLLISKMPKHDTELIRNLTLQELDEVDHGEMALKDYIALGGDEEFARNFRRTPAALAFDGMWWEFARSENPFCYLGAMYPFEGLTPEFSERAKRIMLGTGAQEDELGFVVFHAEEDIAHAALVRNTIKRVVMTYPGAAEHIEYGLECFMQLFPLPIWQFAFERALAMAGPGHSASNAS